MYRLCINNIASALNIWRKSVPKLTLEFNDAMNEILRQLADKEDTTKVDIIRRALALYKYVEEEVKKDNRRKLAITEDDRVLKEIILR